jgi:hypothetical protein
MKRALVVLLLLATAWPAQAQIVNGNDNGNNNTGIGSGNGNGNGNGNGSGNKTSATINSPRNNPTIVAPGLAAAGVESCLGSASIGGAGGGFGLTFGSTVTDRGCNLRLYARTLFALGHRQAATQILCNDPDVARALSTEGIDCGYGSPPSAFSASYVEAKPPRPAHTGRAPDMAPPALPAEASGACRHYELFRGCVD